jgi:hypothetical protein
MMFNTYFPNRLLKICFNSVLIALFVFPCMIHSQTYFQKVYQSSPFEQEGQDVLPMPDGGYLIAGYTTNSTQYDCNVYIIKTDAAGNLVWTKNYGGIRPDFPYHMIPTADGNYFLIGFSQSYSSGDADIYLLKINPSGDLIWSKTYGGSGNDYGKDIIQTSDGNYLIVGWSNSPSMADQNANLIKIDPAGTVIWNKSYGGSNDDFGHSVQQCADGGFIMLGQTFSYGAGGDAYLVKTDASGNMSWEKTFGGSLSDEGVYVNANNDGSFTFVIRDSSNVGKHIDIRVVKTDASGNQIWSKTYGSTEKDTPKMIQPTSDGGYIIAAISRSFGWINPDMWILKLNSGGDTTWTRHYGGVNNEHCYVVRELADGSYIAVGKTASYGPDMDPIFLKLNSTGGLTIGTKELSVLSGSAKLFPSPAHEVLTVDLGNFKAKKLTITDMLGREVYQRYCKEEQLVSIDINEKIQGTYILKMESETETITKKFIIN